MSNYPNLPGIEVSIQDGGLILPEDTSTESVLIVAPCLKTEVPVDPVLVRQSADLINYFGDYLINGQVNPIAASWKAAFEGGCRRIFLLAVNGTDAQKFAELQDKLFGALEDFQVDHIVFQDVFIDQDIAMTAADVDKPGVIRASHAVESTETLVFPLTVTSAAPGANDTFTIKADGVADKIITLTAKVYADAAALATEINTDIAAATALAGFTAVGANNKIVLTGGKAFTLTGNALASLKLPAASARKRDDQGTLYVGNFGELLAKYCENQTLNYNTVIGYIGATKPATNGLADIKAKVDTLVGLDNNYSGHLQVVAGPELGYIIPGKKDTHYSNGAVTYAALVSTLRPESATTNKPVRGIVGISYNLGLRQLNALSGKKYVSFRLKGTGVYVTDGITTAPDIAQGDYVRQSDFIRLSTLRITHAAVRLVREIADPFVGEPNNMPQRNALNAAIKAGLIAMQKAGAIQDFRFTVVSQGSSAVLGQALVTLELVPAFEMRRVTVDVSLRPLLDLA